MRIEFGFYLFLACSILLVPLRLVIAWLLAVTVHELFHYVALQLFGVKINGLTLSARGVVMETEPLEGYKECICALAGPIGGVMLLLMRRWMPYTAICSLVQSCFNLLPIFPLDGGRAVRSIFIMLNNSKATEKYLANKRNK